MIASLLNQTALMLLCKISAALALMESLLALLANISERPILQASLPLFPLVTKQETHIQKKIFTFTTRQ